MTTEQLIKHIRNVIWDLSGDKEEQAERVLAKLYKRRDRGVSAKKVETFKELSFIEAKKDGLIYQLTDGYLCYDNTRYDTATDALKACNDHLRKTSI